MSVNPELARLMEIVELEEARLRVKARVERKRFIDRGIEDYPEAELYSDLLKDDSPRKEASDLALLGQATWAYRHF